MVQIMKSKFYMWQNGLCITYNLIFKKIELFFIENEISKTDKISEADYIIIGACAAFLPYFDLYKNKMENLKIQSNQKLIIYGCLPIVNHSFFISCTPSNYLIIPPRFPERFEKILDNPKKRWSQIPESTDFRLEDYTDYYPNKKYIAIQEGCTEGCYYCPHQIAIGREKSYPQEQIILQIKTCKDAGAKIIVLEGNNAGSWGLDLIPKQDYKELIQKIVELDGDFEIYLGNLVPKFFVLYGDAFINKKITDIKIPIQSASKSVLRNVGRDQTVEEMIPILKKLRDYNPKLVLRTEIIIGLPTETNEDLLYTLDFVSRFFDKVACFTYDYHPNTQIAKKGLPLIEESIIEDRIRIAMNFFKNFSQLTAVFDCRGKIANKITHCSNNSV